MKIKNLLSLVLLLMLSACAKTPSHLIVAPEIIATPTIDYDNKAMQLNVIDMRTANHIVQILREGEAATILSPQVRIEETISQTLINQWKKQNLSISPLANNKMNIAIEKAVISVTQQTMQYQSQTEIVLKVTLDNGQQTLTSIFKNRGNSDGPLQADIAVLERNFNQRLSSLLTQILAHKELNNFLK